MPTSRRSSTPAKIPAPTEVDALAAIHAHGFPLFAEDALAVVLADRFGAPARAVRALLEQIEVRLDVHGAFFGRLDETWLFRADGAARGPVEARLAGLDGVVAWTLVAGGLAIVRTHARDAVERERRLRALHERLGERPLAQLHRPMPPAPKRKLTRADGALLAAKRAAPTVALDALAASAGLTLKVARERAAKLAEEGPVSFEADPRGSALSHVVVRVAPRSTAAARHALASLEGSIVRAFVPEADDASLVDAFGFAPPAAALAAAREVPGVASVEVRAVERAWRDEAAFDALLRAALTGGA